MKSPKMGWEGWEEFQGDTSDPKLSRQGQECPSTAQAATEATLHLIL